MAYCIAEYPLFIEFELTLVFLLDPVVPFAVRVQVVDDVVFEIEGHTFVALFLLLRFLLLIHHLALQDVF